jgi:transketolase
MRKVFVKEMVKHMKKNKRIYFLTADQGWGIVDEIKKKFPDRFINCGISEQAMIGIAAGLAIAGKTVFCFAITPFLLERPYDFIKTLVHYDQNNIKLIGTGRDKDYKTLGYTHWCTADAKLLEDFKIEQFWPEKAEELPAILERAIKIKKPFYINLRR